MCHNEGSPQTHRCCTFSTREWLKPGTILTWPTFSLCMSSLECVSPLHILFWARFQRVTILIFVPHVNVSGPHANCTQISKQTQDVLFDPLVAHTTHAYLHVLFLQYEGHGKTSPKLPVLFNTESPGCENTTYGEGWYSSGSLGFAWYSNNG